MSSLKGMLSTFYQYQVCQYRVAIAFANNRLPRSNEILTYFVMYHNVGRIFELPGIRLRFCSLPLVICKGEIISDGIWPRPQRNGPNHCPYTLYSRLKS